MRGQPVQRYPRRHRAVQVDRRRADLDRTGQGQPDSRAGVRLHPGGRRAANGTVAVTYYDIRNNTPAPGLLTDYFVVHSHNGGATWSESRITPTSFDDETAPVSRGYFIGDYQGL